MPRINLKPKSAEFEDRSTGKSQQHCEMPGCTERAEYKAPKDRGLNEYHQFCLEHVREYNRAWDFFEGLSDTEIHEHMTNSLYGDRPTWKYGVDGNMEEALYRKAWQAYGRREGPQPGHERRKSGNFNAGRGGAPELEALALMGLEPPLTLKDIKTRYKTLVKKHHPDLNRGCKKSEDLLKRINMAYTVLKLAYKQFEKLPHNA